MLDKFNFAQKQRLAYIDFKLYFTGIVTRSEIVNHFELGLAAATRDINYYKVAKAEHPLFNNNYQIAKKIRQNKASLFVANRQINLCFGLLNFPNLELIFPN